MTTIYNPRIADLDITMGEYSEHMVLQTIKTFTNDDTWKNTKELYGDKYCKWDFENAEGRKAENKGRRIASTAWKTTILPHHKVTANTKEGDLFTFSFTDGVMYIEYKKELFDSFATKLMNVVRAGKYDQPNNPHFEIPISLLKRF
tara:strand:+ start:232 stop:669 length:438 start_codon:yes stop_codon:yes gene_type:complete